MRASVALFWLVSLGCAGTNEPVADTDSDEPTVATVWLAFQVSAGVIASPTLVDPLVGMCTGACSRRPTSPCSGPSMAPSRWPGSTSSAST